MNQAARARGGVHAASPLRAPGRLRRRPRRAGHLARDNLVQQSAELAPHFEGPARPARREERHRHPQLRPGRRDPDRRATRPTVRTFGPA